VTIERIESKIGGVEKFKKRCPILFHLLSEEVLQDLCHLPQLLQLAQFMVDNFNRRFEAGETDEMSIKLFLQDHLDPADRKFLKPLIKIHLTLLDKLKAKLFSFNW